jgi:ubiquinone/menaquinone biosynthesis C-methylase UbiE
MGLGHRIHRSLHGGAGDHGGLMHSPRRYETTAAIAFGGSRRKAYDNLVELSAAAPGEQVLDVGCGPGYLSRRAARAVGPSGRVEGIDPSPEAIAYATRNAPPNATFLVAVAEHLPHPDRTFDVVVSSLAFHHIRPDQRTAALREMRRVLRPGGRLLIADFRPPRNRLVKHLVGAFTGDALKHNPIDELPRLVTDAGFVVTGRGDSSHRLHYIQAVTGP